MATAPFPATAMHPSGARFTLRGMMFIFVLGVSIGLAYWRLPLVGFADAMLASFTTWFVVGIGQRLRRDLTRFRACNCISREARAGLVLQICIDIGILVLLVVAGIARECCRRGSAEGIAWNGRPAASSIANVLFFLAIMGAYWSPPLRVSSRPLWRTIRPIVDIVLIGIAAFWAANVLRDWIQIFGLVQVAIRGVELYQPIRWAGQPLYPARVHPPFMEHYYGRLLAAFTLLAIATAASALMLHDWRRRWTFKAAMAFVAMPCALTAAWLIGWWWNQGLPEISPYFAEAINDNVNNAIVLALWAVLVLVLGAAVAMSLTVTRENAAATSVEAEAHAVMLHEHVAVVGLCIVAVLTAMSIEIWQSFAANFSPGVFSGLTPQIIWWSALRSLQEYATGRTEEMIGLAAVVVLARYLWVRWRRLPEGSQGWLVEPGRFIAMWLVAAATIALVTPIGLWAFFGFALAPIGS